jgi:hypothetical protein
MPLYDRDQVLVVADLMKKNRPDLWELIRQREVIDGLYEGEGEISIYRFIKENIDGISSSGATRVFLGLRALANKELGTKNFGGEL